MTDQKQPQNVEYLNYFGSMTTNRTTCTRDRKSRIAMAKVAFNKKDDFTASNWPEIEESEQYNAIFGIQLCTVLKL